MSFQDIRESAAAALATITFGDGKSLRAEPYWTGTVNTPCAYLDFEIDEQITFGESTSPHDCVLLVKVFDQRDSPRASQQRFDELRDPTSAMSVKQVLEDGDNWDEDVHYCRFISASYTKVEPVAGAEYLTVDWRFGVVL